MAPKQLGAVWYWKEEGGEVRNLFAVSFVFCLYSQRLLQGVLTAQHPWMHYLAPPYSHLESQFLWAPLGHIWVLEQSRTPRHSRKTSIMKDVNQSTSKKKKSILE